MRYTNFNQEKNNNMTMKFQVDIMSLCVRRSKFRMHSAQADHTKLISDVQEATGWKSQALMNPDRMLQVIL